MLTGRHGVFNCYEAFIHIIDSMFNQHAKWLKVTLYLPWRRKIASLNYLLASHVLSDTYFDALITTDKPVIFAFHAIHRLTYRCTNHDNIHAHGYKLKVTNSTHFDMTVLNFSLQTGCPAQAKVCTPDDVGKLFAAIF